MKDWLKDLDTLDATQAKMTIKELAEKFEKSAAGKTEKTRKINGYLYNRLKKTWPGVASMRVVDVKPSHLNEWLAGREATLKNTSYNRNVGYRLRLISK